jgi:single-strand DNA-binding protein
VAGWSSFEEHIMAHVRVIQRHAHLASAVKLEFVNGRDGRIAMATLTAISNTRRGTGEARQEESTAIQWTQWGQQAENAAAYLGKGSHANLVGRLRNNHYQDADGADVYALVFTAEEIDYLDSRTESDTRRERSESQGQGGANTGGAGGGAAPGKPAGRRGSRGDAPHQERDAA